MFRAAAAVVANGPMPAFAKESAADRQAKLAETLKALDFKTNVTMTLYAKYFFALQDVLTYKNGAASTRRATWSPGGGY